MNSVSQYQSRVVSAFLRLELVILEDLGITASNQDAQGGIICNKHCHHILFMLQNPRSRLGISQSTQQLSHNQEFPVMPTKSFLQTFPLRYHGNVTRSPGRNKHSRIQSLRNSHSLVQQFSISSAKSLFQQCFHSLLSTDLCTWQNHAIHPTKIFPSGTSLTSKHQNPSAQTQETPL